MTYHFECPGCGKRNYHHSREPVGNDCLGPLACKRKPCTRTGIYWIARDKSEEWAVKGFKGPQAGEPTVSPAL